MGAVGEHPEQGVGSGGARGEDSRRDSFLGEATLLFLKHPALKEAGQ